MSNVHRALSSMPQQQRAAQGGSTTATGVARRQGGKDNKDGKDQTKVRVLVCAPSNTAVDEVVFRLKKDGVIGAYGSRRHVMVVRVGQAGGDGSTNARDRTARNSSNMNDIIQVRTALHSALCD